MGAQEGIDSGFAATYVPQDVAAAQHRARTRADARGNLAAMCCDWYAVEPRRAGDRDAGVHLAARDFAELAAILGLDERPERKPGTCGGCGTDLPIVTANSRATSAEYARGLCRACTAARKETR